MPRKRQAKAQSVNDTRSSVEDTRTPEEVADERIAAWKRDPNKFDSIGLLSLNALGLKKVPETLREARYVHYLDLSYNLSCSLQESLAIEVTIETGSDHKESHFQFKAL